MGAKYFFWSIILLIGSPSLAQLGVGTVEPNASAMLDVVSEERGMLVPRIALVSTTDATTIANGNVASLLVYNTSTSMDVVPGFYYWSDGVWNRLTIERDIRNLPRDVVSSNGSITGVADAAALVAMDLEVNVDNTTLEVDVVDGVQIKDSGVDTAKLLDGTILEEDLSDDVVTSSKIGTGGTTDANKVLGTDNMGDPQWQDSAALAASLGEDVISTNGSIIGVKANATLAPMDLEVKVDNTTLEVDLSNGVRVRESGITTDKVADNAVTIEKIGAGGTGNANSILGTDTAGDPQWQDAVALAASLGEDVTSTDGSIIGTAPNAVLVPMDLEVKVDNATLEVDSANGVQLRDGGIRTTKMADDAVTIEKIGTGGMGDANRVLGTDASGDPQWQDAVALAVSLGEDVASTDGSITGTVPGAVLASMDLEVNVDNATLEVDLANGVQVRDGGIGTVNIADNAVTSIKILDSAIAEADLANGAITSPKILDATIAEVDLADGAVTSPKILDGSITEVDLADGAVTSPKILDATIISDDLANNAVISSKIMDGTIIASDLAISAVITDKIADNAVDGTKIQVAGEVQGAMLFNNGTDWVSLPNGSPGQVLAMNASGTAPQWVNHPPSRIGEFVYAKSGRTVAEGYLPVNPGTVANGAVDFPLWASLYPEFVQGNDIVFPTDVEGMFLRNTGGNAATEGAFQNYRTARPINDFLTDTTGSHSHTFPIHDVDQDQTGAADGSGNVDGSPSTNSAGDHSHTINGGGDTETNPINRAYQLYTIVDN